MKPVLAVLAVLLLVPAAASARPIDVTPITVHGTNVAAPDQQSPKAIPVQVRGTNVAAPDQQSPNTAPAPVHVAAAASPGFDWGTAAIGAATSLVLMTALFGVGLTVRRRQSAATG
jgi:hypothetical protein